MSRSDPEFQVIIPPAIADAFRAWLGQHGRYLFLIPGTGEDLVTYGIGPDWQGVPARRQPPPEPGPAGLPVPRYEASTGIRPANAHRGRFRGIVYEVVEGGRVELHACDHDHAPGVRDARRADDSGREAALLCAEDWAAAHIRGGGFSLPVIREAS